MTSAEASRRKSELLSIECPEPDLTEALERAKQLLTRSDADLLLHGNLRPTSASNDWQTLLRLCSNAEEAALAINALAEQLLGFQPDSQRERVVLSPRFPEHWSFLKIENIKIADDAIRLEYERNSSGSLFTIMQTSGAYPLRLIFQPLMPEGTRQITIDGKPAELDLKGNVAPVQIMLDETRVVAFEIA